MLTSAHPQLLCVLLALATTLLQITSAGTIAPGSNTTPVHSNATETATTDRPAAPHDLPGAVKIEAGFCDPTGRCSCSITVPNSCTADETYGEIMTLKIRVNEVDRYLSGSFLRYLAANVTQLSSRLQVLESLTHTQSISVTLTEIEFLRTELQHVVLLLASLDGKVDGTVSAKIKEELDSIMLQLTRIEDTNPVAIQSGLHLEIAELKLRLSRCKEESTLLGASPFSSDSIPVSDTNFQSCASIANKTLKIGPQVTHKWRNSGVPVSWYKDPLPTNATSAGTIYEIRHNHAQNQVLYTWSNYQDYASARAEYLMKTKCLFHISGRKHLILKNHLYYYDAWSTLVSKMDLSTCKVTQTLKQTIEAAATNLYMIGEASFADINYDETGMYVTYTAAAYTGVLLIVKIDPDTMLPISTWESGRQKSTIANVFFICGKMYTTDSFTLTHLTGKQFGYDTITGTDFVADFDVESRYNRVVQLSYNPRERMLIGVDNSHLVTYDVFFV